MGKEIEKEEIGYHERKLENTKTWEVRKGVVKNTMGLIDKRTSSRNMNHAGMIKLLTSLVVLCLEI